MKPNNIKLDMSRTLTDLEGGFITSDVCHNYGIVDGCDEGCPALLSGDCKQPHDALDVCDITDDERDEILAQYN